MHAGWTPRGMKRPQRAKSIRSVRLLERGVHRPITPACSDPSGQAQHRHMPPHDEQYGSSDAVLSSAPWGGDSAKVLKCPWRVSCRFCVVVVANNNSMNLRKPLLV